MHGVSENVTLGRGLQFVDCLWLVSYRFLIETVERTEAHSAQSTLLENPRQAEGGHHCHQHQQDVG